MSDASSARLFQNDLYANGGNCRDRSADVIQRDAATTSVETRLAASLQRDCYLAARALFRITWTGAIS